VPSVRETLMGVSVSGLYLPIAMMESVRVLRLRSGGIRSIDSAQS
jgi:hypothetical protein